LKKKIEKKKKTNKNNSYSLHSNSNQNPMHFLPLLMRLYSIYNRK